MKRFDQILGAGDLRSIGRSNDVVAMIQGQNDFDQLFPFLFHSDRKIAGRTADAIEKVTRSNYNYLAAHKAGVLTLLEEAKNIELKWHLAQLASRLSLNCTELKSVWDTLSDWAKDRNESRIVRVNSLQSLFNLQQLNHGYSEKFRKIITVLEEEQIPSLGSRIRKLKDKGF